MFSHQNNCFITVVLALSRSVADFGEMESDQKNLLLNAVFCIKK